MIVRPARARHCENFDDFESDESAMNPTSSTASFRRFFELASQARILRNALRIALCVGSVLNLINQGANFLGAAPVSWPHVCLNYLVPFCVATYSATANEMSRTRDSEPG